MWCCLGIPPFGVSVRDQEDLNCLSVMWDVRVVFEPAAALRLDPEAAGFYSGYGDNKSHPSKQRGFLPTECSACARRRVQPCPGCIL